MLAGNLREMFDRTTKGWEFQDTNSQRYSQLFKFHESLGVGVRASGFWILADMTQRTGLYVYDPKALHQIVVKEQSVFEEPRWFIS